MRMKWMLSLLACIFLFAGCTSYDSLNSPSLTKFRDGIEDKFPNHINNLSVSMAPTQLEFLFTLKAPTDDERKLNIVRETSRYVNSDNFKNEIIQGEYFKKYSKDNHAYPNISISLDTDDDGEANVEYRADYEGNGYTSWWLNDFKSDPVHVNLE